MPVNKVTEKTAAEPKGGFYAAVRRVQTQRSAATISNGANIVFGPTTTRKTLFSRTTRVPVKGSISIPYGVFADMEAKEKCATDADASDPMDARSLLVKNYGARFLLCTDAMEDAPELEDFYMKSLRNSLERTVDKNIIYTSGSTTSGLLGIIGPSTANAPAADAVARGSVALNNAQAGEVSINDIQLLIACLDPYSYSVEDLVILLRPDTWQEFIATVTAAGVTCCNRINQAERTLDGYSVFLSPGIPAGQAGVAAMANYVIGVRKDLELSPCGSCDTTIKAKARLAGAMAGLGGGSALNATHNTGTIALGAEGVYAAYLTGVAGSVS